MRHFFLKYLFFALILAFPRLISQQQYHFKNYTVDNGLPFVQVFCAMQDSKGYLWTGGYGGLSRFDGKEFINYAPKNGLVNHYVNAVCEGDSGVMYVATVEGLSIVKNKQTFNYTLKNGLPENNISCIYFDKHKGLYLGCRNGLYILKDKKFNTVSALKNKEIKCILKTNNNIICIGTSSGLFYLTERTGEISKQEGLESDGVNCLAICPETGHILVGTTNGFSKIETPNGKPLNYHIEHGLIDENINAILCEGKSSVWLGSVNGLMNFNGKSFSYYKIYTDNNANNIRCIIKDTEQNIWLGTHSGLFKYRDNTFSSFGKETDIGNAFVFQIMRDKQNGLWFCTDNKGIFKYDQGFFKNYTVKDGLPSNACYSAFEEEDGSILFGTDKGIVVFNNGKFKSLMPEKEFPIKGQISGIYKDSKKIIWTGGQNEVAAIKKNNGLYTATFYEIPSVLKESGVQSFVEDKNGGLWMGTFLSGIYKFEDGKFVYQNKKAGINPDAFFMLLCDKNNVLYGATLNGLWIYDLNSGTQELISEKEGLNSELIYSIMLSQNDDVLWIGTNQGVNQLDLKKYRENHVIDIKAYGKSEGFTGVECNNYGIWEDNDGTIWFGTVSGVVKYEPKAFKKNTELSKTYIQSIKLLNEDTILSNNSVLPYNYNNIAFYYRGICFTNPEKVKYIKKLEGFENKWSEPDSDDYIKYANLPAGSYTFMVKSCNNEGVWNEDPAKFVFEIKTPFYKTWWFISLLIIGVSGVVLLVFKLRLRNIQRKEKAEFEKKVEISKVELKALRAQMNPHFVFNSLNSIQHYILYSKSDEAAKYLNKFAKLIRIILNNSEKAMVTVNEDVESIKLYIELEQMRFDGKFDYSINVDPSVDGDYDEIPPMLMQPYIENAILHGLNPKAEKGHLKIDIFTKNNYIVCRITDDGIGRAKSGEIKRTQPGQQHKSLGMKITSDRLKILNSINKSSLSVSISDIKSENGTVSGTMVELFIPNYN